MDKLTKNIKLLVLDLDGTLTNEKKEITPRTKATLMKLQEQGIKLVLASGRPTYGVVPLAEELDMANYGGYILSYNGGTIINCQTKENLHQSSLEPKYIPELYDIAKKGGMEILSYQDEFIVSEDVNNQYVQYESMLTKMQVKAVDCFKAALVKDVSKCIITGNPDELALMEKEMQEIYDGRMSIYRSEKFYLEVNPMGIDKANSLRMLLEKLNMTEENMAACGDGYNDLTMIQLAGLGVAMANAQDSVKEAAQYITTSNEEDGVADFVEKYLLLQAN